MACIAKRVIARPLARSAQHAQCGVHITTHPNSRTLIVVTHLVGRQLQAQALKAHAVVVAYRALVLLAQDVGRTAAEKGHAGRSRQRACYAEH
jgi:hypothetical protein